MSRVTGMAIIGDQLAAVHVRGDRVVARSSAFITGDALDVNAIDRLLSDVRGGAQRVRVIVCIRRGQVRLIQGLPVTQPALANAVVRENSRQFFVQSWPRLALAPLIFERDGSILGAAFDAAAVDAVMAGAAAAKCTVTAIGVTTASTPADAIEAAEWVARHRLVGPVLRPGVEERSRLIRRIALALVWCAASLAWTAAAFLPGVRATLEARRLDHDIISFGALEADLARTRSELAHTERRLGIVSTVARNRDAALRVLADVTRLAPDSTAIISLRIDSADVSFVAQSPTIAAVAQAFANDSMAQGLRIVGPITRDGNGGLERAAFRFRRLGPRSRPAPRPGR